MSFDIPEGQFVCIVGRSGAGKSTLMRCHGQTASDVRVKVAVTRFTVAEAIRSS